MNSEDIKAKSLQVLSQLDWKLDSNQIRSLADKLIDRGNDEISKLIALPKDHRTFDNVIKKLDSIFHDLSTLAASIFFPSYISTEPDVRKSSTESNQKISKYFIDVGMREDLYQAVKDAKMNSYDKLDEIDKRRIDRELRNFKRNGLDLDDTSKKRIKELKEEISTTAIEFTQVMNEVNDVVVYNEEELQGIPKKTISNFKTNSEGKYLVGMSYPEVLPVLDYAQRPETRMKMVKIYFNRGLEQGNLQRIEKLVELRNEQAKILGYDNHASYALEIKMAKDPTTVINFLNDLIEKLQVKGKADLELLKVAKRKELELENVEIPFEDWRYYKRMVVEERYDVDEQLIKEYFPMKQTVEGMLQFYQNILGLNFVEIHDVSTWHEDVQVYAILDKETDEFIGNFYLDLFPRDGKFSHAAAWSLVPGRRMEDGSYHYPVSSMVCNFNKPTEDTPSLLLHSEVVTLYHEFGHIMHQTVTKARYAEFSGSSVSRDFVEAPSQMLENWIWEPSILAEITSHYETSEPMPKELIKKLVNSRYAFSGLTELRQLFFGKIDMIAYTSPKVDFDMLWHELYPNVAIINSATGTSPAAGFRHIVSGYDAGYYGYMWSRVIAQDMYTKFQEKGITSPEVGMEYRRHILETGNDYDENDIVENFLGRKVNNEAFLKDLGILE